MLPKLKILQILIKYPQLHFQFVKNAEMMDLCAQSLPRQHIIQLLMEVAPYLIQHS